MSDARWYAGVVDARRPEDANAIDPADAELDIGELPAPDCIDTSLIRWMLGLSATERLQAAQDMVDAAWELRNGPGTH